MSSLRSTHIPKDIADMLWPREEFEVSIRQDDQTAVTGATKVTIQTAHGEAVTVGLNDMKSDPEVRRQLGEVVKSAVSKGARRRGGNRDHEAERAAAEILTEVAEEAADKRYQLPPPPLGEYDPAPDLQELCDRLLDEFEDNPHVQQLAWNVEDAEIHFAWKQKGGSSNGKATLGKCVKLSGAARYFAGGADFLIWFAWDHCAARKITERQALALMFHELSHIEKLVDEETGEITYAIKGHDIEAFNSEILVFGEWWPDLKATGDAFRQLSLGFK